MNRATDHPNLHWLDLPEDDEREEPTPERKPLSSFACSQTLLVAYALPVLARANFKSFRLVEFPVRGDGYYLNCSFDEGGYTFAKVVGYILNRNPDFRHKFSGWANVC